MASCIATTAFVVGSTPLASSAVEDSTLGSAVTASYRAMAAEVAAAVDSATVVAAFIAFEPVGGGPSFAVAFASVKAFAFARACSTEGGTTALCPLGTSIGRLGRRVTETFG